MSKKIDVDACHTDVEVCHIGAEVLHIDAEVSHIDAEDFSTDVTRRITVALSLHILRNYPKNEHEYDRTLIIPIGILMLFTFKFDSFKNNSSEED